MCRAGKIFLLLFLSFISAAAHEFWLAPARFFLPAGAAVKLYLLVGDNFAGRPWRGTSSRLTRFAHYTPTDSTDLLPYATQPDSLRTTVTFRQPGTHLVALATNQAFLTLDADKFTAYLREEGLTDVLARRQREGTTGQPGREAYQRCAKTLVQAGPVLIAPDTACRRVIGLPLELVPEQNPYQLRPGASLTVRVLAAGQPVPGALVQIWRHTPGQPVHVSKIYSNQNGRILFRLTSPGRYLLSTLRMRPATDPQTADWQTVWSSLTFGFISNSTR